MAAAFALATTAAGCSIVNAYPGEAAEVCDNALDDDLDGRVDCADDDCQASLGACTERCDDGVDDDGDGLVDCDDPGCDGSCAEADGLCFDGRDNDGDALVDWRDPRCWGVAATLTVDECASVDGGAWDLRPELGVLWVADASVRVEALSDGRSALVPAAGAYTRLRSRPVTTGSFGGMEASVEVAFFPAGGTVACDFVEPLSDVYSGIPPRLEVRVAADGLWTVEVTEDLGFMELVTTYEVSAPTDGPLVLVLHMRPAPPDPPGIFSSTATWEILDPAGAVVGTFELSSHSDAMPLDLRVGISGGAGLVSATVTRPSFHPCNGGAPRPEAALRTEPDPSGPLPLAGYGPPRADLSPDGSICVLLGTIGEWWRFERAADGSYDGDGGELLRVIPETEIRALDAMYLDAASGEVHGVVEIDGEIHRVYGGACGEPLSRVGTPFLPPNDAFVSGLAPRDGGGEEILLAIAGRTYLLARSDAASPSTFVVDEEPLAMLNDYVVARRLGSDWVGVTRAPGGSFDTAGAMRFVTIGDETPFATIEPPDTAGEWGSDGTLLSALVLAPNADVGLDGLWVQTAYARSTNHQGVLVSSVSLRARR